MASLFDRNLLPDFESIRGKDEEILWSGRPAFVPFVAGGLFAGLPAIIIGLILLVSSHFSTYEVDSSRFGLLILWFVSLLSIGQGLWSIAYRVLSYNNTRYAYSNRRIIVRTGFFGTGFKSVDFDKITDIEVKVNFVERLYDVGTVQFFSGRTESNDDTVSKVYDKWHSVALPYELFRDVKEVILDIKTDYNYPNALRPETNPGYNTRYTKK